jgi:hypothetical protein
MAKALPKGNTKPRSVEDATMRDHEEPAKPDPFKLVMEGTLNNLIPNS